MNLIEGTVAIIIGGLGVLGQSFGRSLCKHGPPKGIVFADLTSKSNDQINEELSKEFGDIAHFIKTDVTKTSDVLNLFEKTVEKFKQVDIICNNAGVCNEEDFEHCMDVNITGVARGTWLAIRKFLPEFKKGPGFIINTASVGGLMPIGVPVYGTTKFAVNAITLNLRADPTCLKHDIRVMSICPGATKSPLMSEGEKGFKDLIPVFENADYLGEGLVKMIKTGKHGSVWLCQNGDKAEEISYEEFLNYTAGKILGPKAEK